MKRPGWLAGLALLAGFGALGPGAAPRPPPTPPLEQAAPLGTPGAPRPVAKRVNTPVFAHVMPWFESKAFSGYWGRHWTMANRNPEVVDGLGRRQIAAHYYPLIGPYASADPDVIEYQLLLMKFSGIDGVLLDWPGLADLYDYPRNRANAEAMIARLGEVGLTFGVVYEDRNVGVAARQGVVADKVGQARADMSYLQTNYFPQHTYQRVGGRPLLGVFGPQTFGTPGEWRRVLSGLNPKPCLVTLWYEHPEAAGSSDCTGEYAWVYQDAARTHLQHLRDFYTGRQDFGVKIGSAYPGFHDFYAQGGWGSNLFRIEADGTATLSETLGLALGAGVPYLQLATWNDYGEGTMLEPTREFGYSLLTTLQETLGVPYGQRELELVAALYAQRRQYRGNAAQGARLDRAAAFLAALQLGEARSTLAATP